MFYLNLTPLNPHVERLITKQRKNEKNKKKPPQPSEEETKNSNIGK